MREQMQKRASDRSKLFARLRRGLWLTTPSMIRAAGHRFSARLYELRQLGCIIERRKTVLGFEYRLLQGPKQRRLWP